MVEKTYTISDLASEFDVTTRTIRFYEEKALIKPGRSGNNRVYTPADRIKLRLILRGKRLGFTLEESRDIIAMYDPARGNLEQLEKLANGIRNKRMQLELQLRDIEAMIVDLREAEKKCLKALPDATAQKPQHA